MVSVPVSGEGGSIDNIANNAALTAYYSITHEGTVNEHTTITSMLVQTQ